MAETDVFVLIESVNYGEGEVSGAYWTLEEAQTAGGAPDEAWERNGDDGSTWWFDRFTIEQTQLHGASPAGRGARPLSA